MHLSLNATGISIDEDGIKVLMGWERSRDRESEMN